MGEGASSSPFLLPLEWGTVRWTVAGVAPEIQNRVAFAIGVNITDDEDAIRRENNNNNNKTLGGSHRGSRHRIVVLQDGVCGGKVTQAFGGGTGGHCIGGIRYRGDEAVVSGAAAVADILGIPKITLIAIPIEKTRRRASMISSSFIADGMLHTPSSNNRGSTLAMVAAHEREGERLMGLAERESSSRTKSVQVDFGKGAKLLWMDQGVYVAEARLEGLLLSLDEGDGVRDAKVEIGEVHFRNLFPDARYPTVLGPRGGVRRRSNTGDGLPFVVGHLRQRLNEGGSEVLGRGGSVLVIEQASTHVVPVEVNIETDFVEYFLDLLRGGEDSDNHSSLVDPSQSLTSRSSSTSLLLAAYLDSGARAVWEAGHGKMGGVVHVGHMEIGDLLVRFTYDGLSVETESLDILGGLISGVVQFLSFFVEKK